jgi:hypothetical protein
MHEEVRKRTIPPSSEQSCLYCHARRRIIERKKPQGRREKRKEISEGK